MGFGRENPTGCNFTPLVVIHGQIPTNIKICYRHKVNIASTKIVKICSQTRN